MPTLRGFDPSTYNSSSGTEFTLEGVYSYQGRDFRFVRAASAAGDVAVADGVLCAQAATTSGGSTVAPGVVCTAFPAAAGSYLAGSSCVILGVGVGGISLGNYGFILCRGRHTNVLAGPGTTTVGYWQSGNNAGTGGVGAGDNTSDAFEDTFGRCLVAKAANRYTVLVECL